MDKLQNTVEFWQMLVNSTAKTKQAAILPHVKDV